MIDLPSFIRAEAKRAELFTELVKSADAFASIEQTLLERQQHLAVVNQAIEQATADLATAKAAVLTAQVEALAIEQASSKRLAGITAAENAAAVHLGEMETRHQALNAEAAKARATITQAEAVSAALRGTTASAETI